MDTKKRMDASSINIMKYFTSEWCWGDLSDNKIREISQNYDNYINRTYSKLLFPLKLLAKNINLHDGIVKKIKLSPSMENLIFYGVFGDLEIGYFNLKLEYKNVRNFNVNVAFDIFSKKIVEIVRDEIEIIEDKNGIIFFHRFIFSNKSQFQIEFSDCSLKIENANAKNYKKKLCSLVGFSKR